MPPKNMISVTRKIHMPRLAASFCCSSVGEVVQEGRVLVGFVVQPWLADYCATGTSSLDLVVVVGFPGHDRLLFKVERGRRRRNRPLQTRPRSRDYPAQACRSASTTGNKSWEAGSRPPGSVAPAVDSTFRIWNSGECE